MLEEAPAGLNYQAVDGWCMKDAASRVFEGGGVSGCD